MKKPTKKLKYTLKCVFKKRFILYNRLTQAIEKYYNLVKNLNKF